MAWNRLYDAADELMSYDGDDSDEGDDVVASSSGVVDGVRASSWDDDGDATSSDLSGVRSSGGGYSLPEYDTSEITKPIYHSYMDEWKQSYPLEDEASFAKRRRRAKNAKLLASISDGIASMANLWGTSQYAPSFYNADTKGLSSQAQSAYDKMLENREKELQGYITGAQRARQMDEAMSENERNWRLAMQKQRNENAQKQFENSLKIGESERKDAEEARRQSLRPIQARLLSAQAEEQRVKAANAQRIADATVNKLNRAGSKSSGGSGDKTTYRTIQQAGNEWVEVICNNEKEWDSAVRTAVAQYNSDCDEFERIDEWEEVTTSSSTTKGVTNTTDSTRKTEYRKKTTAELNAELQQKAGVFVTYPRASGGSSGGSAVIEKEDY